jgi:hypothetical protein
MKVRMLVINNAENKIDTALKRAMKNISNQEETQEEYIDRVVHGKEKTPNPNIIIDLTEELEETDFYFRMEDVISIYRLVDHNKNLMIIDVAGKLIDCIFEQDKFDEIIKELN